jgi:cytochrome bd-type quinol oxidase subunit 2
MRVNKTTLRLLNVLALLLTASFCALYISYYLNIEANPGFKYTHYNEFDNLTTGVVIFVSVVLITYWITFLVAIYANLSHIRKSETSTRVVFGSSLVMQLILVGTVCGGVYSQHYANGGAQLFCVGLVNLYIYTLAFLNWPIVVKYAEYDISEALEMQQTLNQDPEIYLRKPMPTCEENDDIVEEEIKIEF